LPAAPAQPPILPPQQQPYQNPQQQQPQQTQQPPLQQISPVERPLPKKQLGGCGCFVLLIIIMMILAGAVSVMRSKTYMQNLQPTPQNVIPVPPGGFRPPQTDDPRGAFAARVLKIDPDSLGSYFRIDGADRTATSFRTPRDDGRSTSTTVITLRVTALKDVDFSDSHFAVDDVDDANGNATPVAAAVHVNPDGQSSDTWRRGQSGVIIVCIDEYAYSTTLRFALRLEPGAPSYPHLTTVR
jgi:hypothetical protein